jgi:aspartyl-tRNA(Asn)/glutamyl-tRNA(Gln) amidotransferase subunit C
MVARVAQLARLALSPAELDVYAEQLGEMLEHAGRLAELEGLECVGQERERAEPLMRARLRPDQEQLGLGRDALLSQAPVHKDGYLIVPPGAKE